MAEIRYPEDPQAREYLRDALRRQGTDSIDEIAAAIRERWHHSPLRSYRLAHEMSLEEVCKQVNRLLDVFADDEGYFRHATLSRFEHWPTTTQSRRPSVSHLVTLAQVYGTTPRRLIAPADWAKLPQADRYALDAFEAGARATAPAQSTGMMETAGPQAGPIHSPPNSWASPDTIRSGNPIERAVLMTGEESAQYADRGSAVGGAALDQVREETAALAAKFANANRVELFSSIRLLRDRIFHLLDMPGRAGVSQTTDLYFLAAAACGLLAGVSDDLGYSSAAMSHAHAGHVFAREAGDPSLTAWLCAVQANICYWNAQPGKARDYAERGWDARPVGTVSVWLPSIEARACGELRDVDGVRTAVRRAAETREAVRPGPLDAFGGQLGFSQGKQHFYAAGAYLGIGDDQAVIDQANSAVEAYAAGPPAEYDYINTTNSRFHAAIAHVRGGDLDAASEPTLAALSVAPEHRTAQIDKSARRLHRQLCASPVQNARLAIETRDQIEEFLSVTPARLELS